MEVKGPAGDRIEEFRFPSKRDARVADLLAEGRVLAPANGQPIEPGQFRAFERLGKYFLRVAGGIFSRPPVPTKTVQTAPAAVFVPTETVQEPRQIVPETEGQKIATPRPESEQQVRQRAAAREARWRAHRREVDAQRDAVLALLAAGESVTATMKKSGLSRGSVKRLAAGQSFLCPCGRDAAHRGACSVRYEVTPARLAAQEKARERTMSPAGRQQARERATAMQAKYTPAERSARTKAMHAARGEERQKETGAKSAAERVRRHREQRRRAAARVGSENRLNVRLRGGGVLTVSTSTLNLEKLTDGDRKLLVDLAVVVERFRRKAWPGES